MTHRTQLGDQRRAVPAGQLATRLAADGVELVAATFIDNAGISRVKGVPTEQLAEAAVWGVGFSPVSDVYVLDDSFTSSASAGGPVGDLRLIPDLAQLTELAAQSGWAWAPVDRFAQDGAPHPQCQRHVVRRLVGRLADHGLTVQCAFEIEWMLSASAGDDFVPATVAPAYGANRMVELSDYCVDLARALREEGLGVRQLHPEYALGQFEVSITATDPLTAADHNVLARQTIRAIGEHYGLRTTFSPCAVVGGVGNGMHAHFSLWHGDRNEAAGGNGPHGMTSTAASFLAGVLADLPAMLAVTAPSVASYYRLQPLHWSAPFRCWGAENREAAVRTISGPTGQRKASANAELKTIDASASPYLAIAAILAAGLDGLDRGLALPVEVSVDPGTLSDSDLAERGIDRLPVDLPSAIDRFEQSDVMIEWLGRELHETLVAVRRAEIALFADASDDEIISATRWRH